jgi:hypothetical protein
MGDEAAPWWSAALTGQHVFAKMNAGDVRFVP